LGDRESTRNNLRREAKIRGVSAERLVFAGRAPYEKHLARLRLADLFLDTPIFSAGASASDALWAGVPVLTCPGEAFASRMSGSLLRAVGLPELICPDLATYERKACEVARERLRVERANTPLFDTARFCRNLEKAYLEMLP
jgi:predicted O-linked N-acetylglucosamine transferase (SPINDLY family)